MMYTHRSGLVKQVKFLRTEPEHMKHARFDFELDDVYRRGAILDMAVFITCAVCLVGLFVWVYAK